MGLFSRKKKKEEQQSTGIPKNMIEFDRDIRALMARPDIQCRQDICEAEFEKASGLLDDPTEENVHRAYDLMGNLASQFDYVPAVMWMGDFMENVAEDLSQAVYWYKKASDLGDGNGSRCYADMLMAGKGVAQDMKLAMHYYADAADKGVPEAAFVLGEFFRNTGDREHALQAYQEAADGGYAPAQTRIDQMKSGER